MLGMWLVKTIPPTIALWQAVHGPDIRQDGLLNPTAGAAGLVGYFLDGIDEGYRRLLPLRVRIGLWTNCR
jgi:hypothetical protein